MGEASITSLLGVAGLSAPVHNFGNCEAAPIRLPCGRFLFLAFERLIDGLFRTRCCYHDALLDTKQPGRMFTKSNPARKIRA